MKVAYWKEAKYGRQAYEVEKILEDQDIPQLGQIRKYLDYLDLPIAHSDKVVEEIKIVLVPDTWVRDGHPDELSEPSFSQDTWTKEGESDEVVQPILYAVDTWIKEGESAVTVDPMDETYIFMPAGTVDTSYTAYTSGEVDPRYNLVAEHLEVQAKVDTDYSKPERIAKKYQEMTTDVLNNMAIVFGTTSTESATAYEATWKEMLDAPASYAAAGITSRFAVAGLVVGDALDTDQKVLDYANAKLTEVRNYAIIRMQRIEQFRQEKSAIEAE